MPPRPVYLFETDEHAAVRAQARRFAEREIAPHARAWEEAGEFPRSLYVAAGDAGLLGIGYAAELGGADGDLSHVVVAGEELILTGRSVGTAVGLGSHGIVLPSILAAGTDAQKARFVPSVLCGTSVAALAVTEPEGGSDVAALRARATRDGSSYRLTGTKTFITSGTRADIVLVVARTAAGAGAKGLTMFVVERGAPGFAVSKKLEKLGWWASDTAELHFDDCPVPEANRVGPEGGAFGILMESLSRERLLLAAQAVAIAELAYREAATYAKERVSFGSPIVGHQVIRHMLAEMSTRIAAARALTGEAIVRVLRGEAAAVLAAKAKNTASDACSFVVDAALQIHGGHGYMRELTVERLYRDARLYPIGGGTREVLNELVAKIELA